MKFSVLAAISALGALSACVSDGAYGPPPGYGGIDYGGYYDGYYGPFAGGYWGPGGLFYFLDRSSGRYHPDRGRHFRHEGGPGFNPIQGHAPPPRGRGGAGGRGHPGHGEGRPPQTPPGPAGPGPGPH